MTEHVDVLIIGAGISGVGAAHTVTTAFPGRTLAVLEARDRVGGTWDLFRYPGIRSDSDMHTFAFKFRPWTNDQAIAAGADIRQYVEDTAREGGYLDRIRFGHKVVAAEWSSADSLWTVTAEHAGREVRITTNLLHWCTGYYHYDKGYIPDIPGLADFGGTVIHPQHWPEDFDHTGKRVVVIGSGATAVTLVPSMAGTAAHVTMLQRSPTYIVALPGKDPLTNALRALLGEKASFPVNRWKNVALHAGVYWLSRAFPTFVRAVLRAATIRSLPKGYDVDTHFKPRYNPWDQRLCVVPDGDLFRAIRKGQASVVTDYIAGFTADGVTLKSGRHLAADVVVTATGLRLVALGGVPITVDGERVDLSRTMAYRNMMLTGVPNSLFTIGYTNFSWTLKVGLVSDFTTRLLRYMDAKGLTTVVPVNDDPAVTERPLLAFAAGYVQRAVAAFPKSGSKGLWRVSMNFPKDVLALRFSKVATRGLRFGRGPVAGPAAAAPARQPARSTRG